MVSKEKKAQGARLMALVFTNKIRIFTLTKQILFYKNVMKI